MALAAHDVRRAEYDLIAALDGVLRRLDIGRKLADPATERAKPLPLLRRRDVVGNERDAGCVGALGEARDQIGDLIATAAQRSDQLEEVLTAQAGPLDHGAELWRRIGRVVG